MLQLDCRALMSVVARWMQRRLLQCLGAPIGITFSSESQSIENVRRQQERDQAKVVELQQELDAERERNRAEVMQLQQELEVERERNQRPEDARHTRRSSRTGNARRRQHSSHTENEHHKRHSSHTEHTDRRGHPRQHRHRGHANEEEPIRSAEVAQFASQEAEVVPSQPRVNQRIGVSSGLCVIS